MRWSRPSAGDHRTISKFLIIPKKLKNEVRWLETAKIRQWYSEYYGKWMSEEWAD